MRDNLQKIKDEDEREKGDAISSPSGLDALKQDEVDKKTRNGRVKREKKVKTEE